MTLLKELIDIPEHLQRGDFVLRLSEGVNRPHETLNDYVVTPELTKCFDEALSFIRSALRENTSKASYLHGSFGSGKSHFMAVLHLILRGEPEARGIAELAPVIARHNEWIRDKKFLLVPYHMIGARDMESGILGGYVEFVRRTHPRAPIPGVYLAEGLFRDAENLRQQLGDQRFFATLSQDARDDSDFGDVDAAWDASRFDNAVIAEPGSEERSRLIAALVSRFFGSYDTQAGGHGEAFLSLDKGLSVLSRHAASLGYDGLILFLDELILWLASHAQDLKFVHQEGQKLAKLVEAQTPDRPVPVISFIARQRDLSELIGDAVPGAQRLNFSDALKHWEGRFHRITLEDRNLPAIAEKRVLKCHNLAARQELNAAFDQTRKIRESVMNTLLTSDGDREMFRKVYPFSPALVQTLIAVSSILQRERTALKVMVQLLVEQRELLRVGDIVPVGDLFDVIAHGDEAFSQEMAIHFDNAKRLYHQKLLPLLERQHGRREELLRLGPDDPRWIAFRNDDRLVKTLLLSALVPEVESLRALNADRLAALNHGTIKSPIAGREGQEVLRRCKQWAASVGEIRIGEEENATISVQLSGVDTEGILVQAQREDNQGNRIRRVRQMLFDQLGIQNDGLIDPRHDFLWKNTRRSCAVLCRNIRELVDSSLENSDDDWQLIIDFPFDEPGHGPRDDVSRLQTFLELHPSGAKTICWVPAFFSADAQKDLGTLVVLEHILTGERYAQYSTHLSPQDRQAARSLLENQRSVLRQRVRNHLDVAYGLDSVTTGSLDSEHDMELHERFVSLWPGFDLRPPVAANLADAMQHLLGQALKFEFPAAPDFEAEIKIGNLKKVYEVVGAATRDADGRVAVDRPLRPLMRQIANPLWLGEMGIDATHFVLGQHWKNHFTRKSSEAGGRVRVSDLRRWMDEPRPMGLPREAQNLVILTYAEQTSQTFLSSGVAVEGTLASLSDECILQPEVPPDPVVWQTALQRAASMFGLVGNNLPKAANVASLAAQVQGRAAAARKACHNYHQRLRERIVALGLDLQKSARLRTAAATSALLERLANCEPSEVITELANAQIATTATAMGECAAQAEQLQQHVVGMAWSVFDVVSRLTDHRQPEAAAIQQRIVEALESDEHVVSLGTTIQHQHAKAVRVLGDSGDRAPRRPEPEKKEERSPEAEKRPADPNLGSDPGRGSEQESSDNLDIPAVRELLGRLESKLTEGRRIRIDIRWKIEDEGASS